MPTPFLSISLFYCSIPLLYTHNIAQNITMASNPPGACCVAFNFHEGQAQGDHKLLFGLDTYQIGAQHGNDKVIVIITDIHGHKFNNVLLVADALSKTGKYQVLIPDILKGDPIDRDLQEWIKDHTAEVTLPIVDNFLSTLKKEWNPKFLGGIGYCYGGKYAIQQLSKDGHLDAGAVAHPSFVSIDEVKAITKPLLISAAQVDPIFPPELKFQTEQALAALDGVRYQVDLFSGVSHGFAVKGDITDPVVKYAKEKTVSDQLVWFDQFSK